MLRYVRIEERFGTRMLADPVKASRKRERDEVMRAHALQAPMQRQRAIQQWAE